MPYPSPPLGNVSLRAYEYVAPPPTGTTSLLLEFLRLPLSALWDPYMLMLGLGRDA